MKKIFKIILTFIKVRYFSKWTSRDKLLKYQEKPVLTKGESLPRLALKMRYQVKA